MIQGSLEFRIRRFEEVRRQEFSLGIKQYETGDRPDGVKSEQGIHVLYVIVMITGHLVFLAVHFPSFTMLVAG